MGSLLAVDLGLRTGLALYSPAGRLTWYTSRHFGTNEQLKRGVHSLLGGLPDLAWLVLEGGGSLADVWERAAERRQVPVHRISAETWRQELLYAREQRSGRRAKATAAELARRIIAWSDAPRPTSLRTDAAEAILVGLWGVLAVGWLAELPAEVRHGSE